MDEDWLKKLFCGWCPHDCEDRKVDPLTDEERAGCVASGGFAAKAFEQVEATVLELAVKKKQLVEEARGLNKRCLKCRKTVHVTESYRCYYCQGYVCPEDAREHFATHPPLASGESR